MFLANYVPKCQMSSGPFGPIFCMEALIMLFKKNYGTTMKIVTTSGLRKIQLFLILKELRVHGCICFVIHWTKVPLKLMDHLNCIGDTELYQRDTETHGVVRCVFNYSKGYPFQILQSKLNHEYMRK